ncbi:MAG: hypothetical protein ACM3U2_10495 [Deltaproteobacteria bacterium]
MRIFTSRLPHATVTMALLTILAGCGTSRARLPLARSAPTAAPPRAVLSNVIVVHSTAGYWPDCNRFVDRLEQQGAPATVIRGMELNRTADRIVEARRAGDTRPLVLIGYSRGANDAIRLTRRLQKHDIAVDTLVLMEMAAQDSVPANVAACLNVYKSSPADEWVPAFRGLPVTVESAQTHLVNYNVRFHDEAVEQASINQFTVCQNPAVQGMIVERVAQAVRPADASVEMPETQLAGGPREWGERRADE